MTFDIAAIRAQFPSLQLTDQGRSRIYLDGPAGTQVPQRVIDAVSNCFIHANANLGGTFPTSQAAGRIVDSARAAMADLLGTSNPQSIVLGPNMTGLTKQIAASLAERLSPGDRIVLSRMDHDANISPWLDMAKACGLEIDWLELDPETYQLDLSALEGYLEAGAKLVAVGYASNVLGTINDVEHICALTQRYGALSYIDAVHHAPHGTINVEALGCDMLVCSVYKFFGPHCAGLYIRPDLLDSLPSKPLRPAPKDGPVKFESGTMNHEGLAGSVAAIEYLARLGEVSAGNTRRQKLVSALSAIQSYEQELVWALIDGVKTLKGYTIHGITDKSLKHCRAPTVSLTHTRLSPRDIEQALSKANIFSWAGHSYAIEPLGALGLLETGGVVRLGIAHYNTIEEINAALDVLAAAKGL